ncbi:MAG: radical SAM protein [Gemmatimonadetes bacterium]|nr:radical SAM protein [Gemmatimonadota bacterium]
MFLGFAVTEHCNLRCPHCIRDDVTTVRNLAYEVIERTVDEALEMFPTLAVSMTGGEPTLHPEWDRITGMLHARDLPYTFVTNGWHMRRMMPSLDRHPPASVRLSLSGATEQVHDDERGRGSFRRVLQAVALLTSRRIPPTLSLIVDRRSRHQLRTAADLAEALGCTRLHFILPQPVPGSAARDSDLAPEAWAGVRDEVFALRGEPGRRTHLQLDYGYPFDGAERTCDTFGGKRVYGDARGRLSVCCQLSEYGENEADVVADLNRVPFAEAWPAYQAAVARLRDDARPSADPADPFDRFPCMRCARARGKTAWLAGYPGTPWHHIAAATPAVRPLVALSYGGGPRGLAGAGP